MRIMYRNRSVNFEKFCEMRSEERMTGTYEKLVSDRELMKKFPYLKKAIKRPEVRDICEWICAGGAETPEMRKRMYELAFSGRVEKA